MGLQLERLVIGLEEPILIKDLGEITAKIDSGNGGYNVIHGEDIIYQGDRITFKTFDGLNNERLITKKVKEELEIHIGGGITQKRPVIELDVKFANEEYKKIPFSVTDRSSNTHKILISKDFVEKTIDALIDVGAKNISNLNYDVDYKSVNEANDFGNINSEHKDAIKNATPKKEEKKPSLLKRAANAVSLDNINRVANGLRPHGQFDFAKSEKKDKEVVEEWQKASTIFADYSDFYKKDQKNIQTQINSATEILQEFKNGDNTGLLIGSDGKITGASLNGVSVFSYTLKKGDAGSNGQGGVVIKGLEEERKKWFDINEECKEALDKIKEEEANAEKTSETNDNANADKNNVTPDANNTQPNISDNPSLDSERQKMMNNAENMGVSESFSFEKSRDILLEEVDYGGNTVGSKSLDATKMPMGSKASPDVDSKNEKSFYSRERVEEIKGEISKIEALKGFICYYISLNGEKKEKEEVIKTMNGTVLSGSFDTAMKEFIDTGDGSNVANVEKVANLIKQHFSKNKDLLKKMTGVFALCYSENLIKGAPRSIKFLSKNSILKEIYETFDKEKIKKQLIQKYGLLEDEDVSDDNINDLINLISKPQNTEMSEVNYNNPESIKNILKEKLSLPSNEDISDENVKELINLITPERGGEDVSISRQINPKNETENVSPIEKETVKN
jgi:hypothetical protein